MFEQRYSKFAPSEIKPEEKFKVEKPGEIIGEEFTTIAENPMATDVVEGRLSEEKSKEKTQGIQAISKVEEDIKQREQELKEAQDRSDYLKNIQGISQTRNLEGLSGARRLAALKEMVRAGQIGETGAAKQALEAKEASETALTGISSKRDEYIKNLQDQLATQLTATYGEGGIAQMDADILKERINNYQDQLKDLGLSDTEIQTLTNNITTEMGKQTTEEGKITSEQGTIEATKANIKNRLDQLLKDNKISIDQYNTDINIINTTKNPAVLKAIKEEEDKISGYGVEQTKQKELLELLILE